MKTALFIAALGIFPAFQPGPEYPPRPLWWETPVSWAPAPAEKLEVRLQLSPVLTEKATEAQRIRREKGPGPAAEYLARSPELEMILLRAGLWQMADELGLALADYEKVLQSDDRGSLRALALSGYKNVLRRGIAAGEKHFYGPLIQSLKDEWRNEEALDILEKIRLDTTLPAKTLAEIRVHEPIMALRLGRYDRAAELWANPTTTAETQWLAQTEQRRGNFERAAQLRLSLGSKIGSETKKAWELLAKGGLFPQALAVAEKHPALKKGGDYNWRMGLAALNGQEYEKARQFFEKALKKPDEKAQAGVKYFLARTLEKQGRPEEARQLYSEVGAGPFGYYKILALGRLAGSLGSGGTLSPALAGLLTGGPSGRDQSSLGFWLWVTEKGLSPEELSPLTGVQLGGEYQHLWSAFNPTATALGGNYRGAVRLFSRQPSLPGAQGLQRWSHPLVFGRQVLGAYREHGLPPALVLALIRTESAYQPDIMSASNARGLMQLLPATANKIAVALGEPEPGALDLFSPGLNIRYGSWYLKQLQTGLGHEALALAAYNGGPYNIKSLILAKPQMPIDIFVESLPFDETAKYVKRIIESRYIYEMGYLGRATLPDLTGAVEPPTSTLPTF